jgi:integrase
MPRPKKQPAKPSDLLDTPAKRRALPARNNPYWFSIGPKIGGVKLGYRKPAGGGAGAWVAKTTTGGDRAQERIGAADDAGPNEAPAAGSLSLADATAAALAWAEARRRRKARDAEAVASDAAPAPTVADAVRDYIAQRIAQDAKDGRDAELRLSRHVLAAPLATVDLRSLAARDLETWRKGLQRGGRAAAKAARLGEGVAPLAPSTLARLLNDLRAALRAAVRRHRARIDGAAFAAAIEDGLRAPPAATEARGEDKIQYLPPAETARVVASSFDVDRDFGHLVLMLAATGLRLSQVAAIRVGDVQLAQGRVMVPASAKGRSRKAKPPIPVPLGDDVLAALRPLVIGRDAAEPLLLRDHREQTGFDAATGRAVWTVIDRRPWPGSSAMSRPWRTAIAAAGLPAGIVPYALRSSSIIRALQARISVVSVAARHDTGPAMISTHYARWIVQAEQELHRAAAPVLLPPSGAPALRVVSGG